MRLSILVIDLVGYSERLAALEEQMENAGETLNRQIEQFVSHAIATAQLDTSATVLKFTGDGAILKAPNAERAHRIAVALQEASESFNQGRKTALGQRVFRVGIATGEVAEYASLSGATDHGGSTIGRAARMEAGCRPGGITVDEDSYRELPLAIRSQYSDLEEVVDKNGIRYGAYRWKGHCLTRLQETLKKRLEQVASDGSMAERKLLQDLPQLQTVTRLLGWIRQPNHGSAYAIEKLRSAVLPRRVDAPDAAAARLVVLLFLVLAEQRLEEELCAAAKPAANLRISLEERALACLIAACLKNSGLHFEIRSDTTSIDSTNFLTDLPISEPGKKTLTGIVLEEAAARERKLRGLPPTARPAESKLDIRALQARLRVLDEQENIQLIMAFPPDSILAEDVQVKELLTELGIGAFRFGVDAAGATLDVTTTRTLAESLATQLADLLAIVAPHHAPAQSIVVPPDSTAPDGLATGLSERSRARPLVFLSYARHADDARCMQAMAIQLEGLEKSGLIELFIDTRDIKPGQYWNEEIRDKLAKAFVAVFMLSPHFLRSDFIMTQEKPALMRLARFGRVIPVVVSPCVWKLGDLGALQAPLSATPLQMLGDQDLQAAVMEVVTLIAELCRPAP